MPRLTPKDAEGLMNAYAKVYAPKDEPKEESKVEDTPPPESSENNK
jgi:hypothetical protein|tara:strand:- start:418 stop:555 length:138 start_codon:yes stop_codon:yes gene_type:complete